jgi:hypothetical protein
VRSLEAGGFSVEARKKIKKVKKRSCQDRRKPSIKRPPDDGDAAATGRWKEKDLVFSVA